VRPITTKKSHAGVVELPLNETGIAQAHAAKHLFEGIYIGLVVCSPLARARRTEENIWEVVKKPIIVLNEFHVCDLGVRDGDLKEQWYGD
jgi:broad specificity phosphatase PhoE